MNNLAYHKATAADIVTLVENRILFNLELAGEQAQAHIEILRKHLYAYFLKATADKTCISFIATYNDVVAGTGSVHFREMPGNFKNPSGKWGYIMNMYTLPGYRRSGICNSILNLLIEEGVKLGITAFELHATNEGENVYIKNGFHLHHEPTYRKILANPALL